MLVFSFANLREPAKLAERVWAGWGGGAKKESDFLLKKKQAYTIAGKVKFIRRKKKTKRIQLPEKQNASAGKRKASVYNCRKSKMRPPQEEKQAYTIARKVKCVRYKGKSKRLNSLRNKNVSAKRVISKG